MKKIITLIIILSIPGFTDLSAQFNVKDQESVPNTLLQINDEGDAGSITLPPLSAIGTTTNKLYNLGTSLFWNGSELGTAGSAGGWTDDGTIVRLITPTDKVGIGTASPATKLHIAGGMKVQGTEGVVFTGEYSFGPTYGLGAGTVLFWYPRKAAFRAGGVDAAQWDDANVGGYSIASGFNTKASGYASVSFGYSTTASGSYSTSLGGFSIASGDYSTAIGLTNSSSVFSTSVGVNNVGGGSPTSWVETDPLFEIGNAYLGPSNNAMTVLKNGNVGIGIHDPSFKLDISGGDLLVRGTSGNTGTLHLGTVHHYIKGEYGFGLTLGTYVVGDVISVKEVSGNVGINNTSPDAKLDVNGTVKIGANGVKISEIFELTGTLYGPPSNVTSINYPAGYNSENSRVLSLEIETSPDVWVALGYYHDSYPNLSVSCVLAENNITIGYAYNLAVQNQKFRLILAKVE